jgi:hypothetical protein
MSWALSRPQDCCPPGGARQADPSRLRWFSWAISPRVSDAPRSGLVDTARGGLASCGSGRRVVLFRLVSWSSESNREEDSRVGAVQGSGQR